MTQDEIIEMARQADVQIRIYCDDIGVPMLELEAFAKLVAAKAVAKDRKEFDIDELCARQNKIGYKQGYRAGQLAEREACAKVCEEKKTYSMPTPCPDGILGCCVAHYVPVSRMKDARECADEIRARGEA